MTAETGKLIDAIAELDAQVATLQAELKWAKTQIGWLKEDKVSLNKSVKVRDGAIEELLQIGEAATKELDKAKADNRRLREFARHVIRQECWSLCGIDGGDIQELAEKLGLIVSYIATKEDVDDESDHEVGNTIFKFSDVLKEK